MSSSSSLAPTSGSAGTSILGLFPGVGDAITSANSLLIVHHARRTGASRIVLARMLANIGNTHSIGKCWN